MDTYVETIDWNTLKHHLSCWYKTKEKKLEDALFAFLHQELVLFSRGKPHGEDAIQVVMKKIIDQSVPLDSIENMKGYLRRMLRNAALDQLRRNKTQEKFKALPPKEILEDSPFEYLHT